MKRKIYPILASVLFCICAVGCNSAFLDPDYYERTSESTTELFYNGTKLICMPPEGLRPRSTPELFKETLPDCDSTVFWISTGTLVHPHHSNCKHESSISTSILIQFTFPGNISLGDFVERMSEKHIPFSSNKSRVDDYSIFSSEFKRGDNYLFTEGEIYFLQHDKEDEYYEMKIEYKNVYENHVDSFTKGRIKINVHDIRP